MIKNLVPANAIVTIDFISKSNSEILARVYDIAGRVVLSNSYGHSFAGQKGFTRYLYAG